MCEWKSISRENYRCAVPPLGGSNLCLFHSPDSKDETEFHERLQKQMSIGADREVNNQRFDFTGYVFPRGYALRLNNLAIETGIVLDEVVVQGDLYLIDSVVKDGMHIWDSRFLGRFVMDGSEFGGPVVISSSQFVDNLEMDGTVFRRFLTVEATTARKLILGHKRPRIWGRKRRGISIPWFDDAPGFWSFAAEQFCREGELDKADAAHYFRRIAYWRQKRSPSISLIMDRWHHADFRKKKMWTARRIRRELAQLLKRFGALIMCGLECVAVRWPTAYGASITRLAATWAFVLGVFATLFCLWPVKFGVAGGYPAMSKLETIVNGFYHSVTTFATLGLASSPPATTAGKIAVSVEALLGGILIAVSVVLIGRKFMR